jgi:hypothetical protein
MKLRSAALAAIGAVVLAGTLDPTGAAAASTATGTVVALWNFDDAAGAPAARDVSGNGHDAAIDARYSNVQFGQTDSQVGTYAYVDMGLLRAPSTPDLVPGSRDVTVTVQIRTTYSAGFSNFMQKGNYNNGRGFWKIEMSRNHARCRFTGDVATVGFETPTVINDGQWHTITCHKTATYVEQFLDGVQTKRRNVAVGAITNTDDVAIGGKYAKAGGAVDPHDMLHGDINLAQYNLG